MTVQAREYSGSRGRLYSTRAAAEYCGMAEQTLRNRLTAGEFPKAHKQGMLNGWFQDELDAYLRSVLPDYDVVQSAPEMAVAS